MKMREGTEKYSVGWKRGGKRGVNGKGEMNVGQGRKGAMEGRDKGPRKSWGA